MTTLTPIELTTRDVRLGNHRLHVHEIGDPKAPTVLWLHGSGPGVTALTNWEHLITDFAGSFHHLAPDILGFGDSSHPENPKELAALPHQTLVIHGREDRFIPVQAGYYFAEHLPNAQLHVLPKTGHWAQLEQPDRFLAQVKLFLNEATHGTEQP